MNAPVTSPPVLRFDAPAPGSWNGESRTFTVVVATSADVERGSHIERMELAGFPLPESLPLMVNHSADVRDQVGTLRNFRLEALDGGHTALVADGQLSAGAPAPLEALLAEGALKNFSVSFSVSHWRESRADGRRVRIASRGRLIEGSFVVSPADPLSQIRSNPMPAPVPSIPSPSAPPADPAPVNRMSDDAFTIICRNAGVPDEIRNALASSPASDDVRLRMALAAVERQQPVIQTNRAHNDNSLDNPAVLRTALSGFYDAINRGAAPEGAAAGLFAQGERAVAERLCRNAGIETLGLTDAEVMRRAATTGDFAIAAGATFGLAMRREMEAAASPIAALFGRDTVSTFNAEVRGMVDWTTLAIADRLESGHYSHSYISESGEEVKVAVLGGITSRSYELGINAGGRLGNEGVQFGKRLTAEIADRQVTFVEQASAAGPTMKDGKTVFHASRGNVGTLTLDGSTEIAQLMKARSDMAARKGAGNVMIGQYPTHWLVHRDFEETALRLLSSVLASAVGDVNVLAGRLKVVVEPRLTNPAKSWLVVEPARMDGAVRVFLQGQEAPFTDSRIDFETDAVQFKIRHPFGLGWLEWRSWTRLDHVEG